MKKLSIYFFLSSAILSAQVHVRGYYRKDGTYVAPHVRSSPDGIKENNYSYKNKNGNYYPYTPSPQSSDNTVSNGEFGYIDRNYPINQEPKEEYRQRKMSPVVFVLILVAGTALGYYGAKMLSE